MQLFRYRDNLESDLEFEVEGDVPAPIPLSPKPGPSTEPEERENQAATGKIEKKYLWGCFGRHAIAFFVTVISVA